MNKQERVNRRRQLRKVTRSNVRQVLFVADYIQTKYPIIYAQAVQFYNQINRLYPAKNDLRKTGTYKEWKQRITLRQQPYPNVETASHPSTQDFETASHPSTQDFETASHPSTQDFETASHPSTQDFETASHPSTQDFETASHPSTQDFETASHPSTQDFETASHPSTQDVVMATGETRSSEPSSPYQKIQKSRELVYNDNLELRIPLMQYSSGSVATETLQTVTQEILAVDSIQPTILEDVSPDLLDKVIEELRAEPELRGIFAQVEQEQLLEEFDIDIDIPGDLLEKELENWGDF